MSELLAMSFDAAASPSIRINVGSGRSTSESAPSGWGFAWYPSGEYSAAVVKDPLPYQDTALSRVLRDWERFRAYVFLCHIRGAVKMRASQENTQPFSRSYAGRDWLFTHNGQLDPRKVNALALGDNPIFEPVGRTDSEHAFCWLLTQIRDLGIRRLGDLDRNLLHQWFQDLNAFGTFNAILSDGQDLIAYRDRDGFNGLHFARLRPPYTNTLLKNNVVEIDMGDPLDINRTMVFVSTTPMCHKGWSPVEPGAMLVSRRGAITWYSHHVDENMTNDFKNPERVPHRTNLWSQAAVLPAAGSGNKGPQDACPSVQPMESQAQIVGNGHATSPWAEAEAKTRILSILHETRYKYEQAVERSTHLFRLQPIHDLNQELLDYSLDISADGETVTFEDVFGNQTTRMKIRNPYTELTLKSQARVRVKMDRPLTSSAKRSVIPLVWMPWQRQMMQAYLLPSELPETQLRELSDFAMSFVERQDYDLLETLHDMNQTIRQDFAYVAKSTTLETTPFDVYVNRRGVCQDFANLFICLSRLLGVPARYRVGYIFTGGDYANKLQSEASHAWVEVYLPWAGWRGFDPTNGCLANLDHVRVASGRNYRDATPTSGTIFKGGKGESLSVSVKVEEEA